MHGYFAWHKVVFLLCNQPAELNAVIKLLFCEVTEVNKQTSKQKDIAKRIIQQVHIRSLASDKSSSPWCFH
mgnify:CR=1 FL=1